MTLLPHLAARLYGVPLAIHRPKLDVILAVLGPRVAYPSSGTDLAAPSGYTPPARAAPGLASPQPGHPPSGVAVIPVHGTLVRRTVGLEAESGLTSYAGLTAQLDAARANPDVAAILLDIDSPGGESSGVFDLADRIRAVAQVKPVWAVANDMAFSAAYALASAASRVFVSRTGGVGSIGVIAMHVDQSQKDTQDGVRYTAVFAGDRKNDLNPHAPLSGEAHGRVPIFRPGGFAVVGHTGRITASVSNGQTIDCARVRLSRVRVVGHNGSVIHSGYTADLEAGTVSFTDVSGYSQPVTVEHRIEDMAVVRDVQISGDISFTRALTHAYPLASLGNSSTGSFVSSALVAGDLFARVNRVFDQGSWNGDWSDEPSGDAATATFNHTQYPIQVTNRGALTERWVVRLTNSTAFEVIGENVGVIATGNTSSDCAPTNPATGAPYFHLPALGWGNGWSTGNVLRFNTIGAQFPVWVVRTVQQGPESVPDDHFTLLIRGDVDTP